MTTWNSDIRCWKLPRYDRTNYNIINDGASHNVDNEVACIKGKDLIWKKIFEKKKKKTDDICILSGGAAIKRYAVLNDKRHILTKDTDSNVAIYDVLKVIKVKDMGPVDFDNELKQHNQKVYIPNWFTVDLKTGVCIID